MKILGLIGGISWVSTLDYYRLINEGINEELGDLNFARCIIHSFNYQDIKTNNDNDDWDRTLAMITEASLHLQDSGAEAIVLCANTMHLIADRLANKLNIPIIHIATETALEIEKQNIRRVGLLGTRFTMERDFFKEKLEKQSIEVLIPSADDRDFIHYTIFEELGRNIFLKQTKERYISVMKNLIADGAKGIILGCTEIPLLIKPEDVQVPVFDTTRIHAAAAVRFSIE